MSDRDIVKLIESCQFRCEAGPLERSQDWIELRVEVDMLRDFYKAWKEFHRVANIHGITDGQKKNYAQNMIDLSHAIDLSRKPIIEMANG